MSEVSTSRRDVMRALAILPSLIAKPVAASAATGLVCLPASDPEWEAALRTKDAAFVASERFYEENVKPANNAHEAGEGCFEDVVRAEDAWLPYNSAHAAAVDALIATPAPDLGAVAHKLHLGIKEWAFDGTHKAMEMLEVIAADIIRLMPAGA